MNHSIVPRPCRISRNIFTSYLVKNPHVHNSFRLNCFKPSAFQEENVTHYHFFVYIHRQGSPWKPKHKCNYKCNSNIWMLYDCLWSYTNTVLLQVLWSLRLNWPEYPSRYKNGTVSTAGMYTFWSTCIHSYTTTLYIPASTYLPLDCVAVSYYMNM